MIPKKTRLLVTKHQGVISTTSHSSVFLDGVFCRVSSQSSNDTNFALLHSVKKRLTKKGSILFRGLDVHIITPQLNWVSTLAF